MQYLKSSRKCIGRHLNLRNLHNNVDEQENLIHVSNATYKVDHTGAQKDVVDHAAYATNTRETEKSIERRNPNSRTYENSVISTALLGDPLEPMRTQ
jgi:hypothetical protein